MVLSINEWIGHFHPLLVHLPIGILLLACLFQWLSVKKKYAYLKSATGIALFWGMLSAIGSCISGYLLSGSGEYEEQLVNQHQWMGISVALVSVLLYILHGKKATPALQPWLCGLLVLLIIVTGHLGGSLTHGEDYLTKPFKKEADEKKGTVVAKAIPQVQEARLYADLIQPLLQDKCYSCHGANKQKGKLRMDEPSLLMKGGKDGVVIEAGSKAEESILIKRIQSPREEEHHMPPKEKKQLTEQEIALLHWWIAAGASFDKKVKEVEQPEKIKPVLLAYQHAPVEKKPAMDIPPGEVEKADDAAIKKLKDIGVVVMPVSAGSHYLLANFVTAMPVTDKGIALLLPLKRQLIWLKLSNSKTSDAALKVIAQCTHITKLQLDNTPITDKGLAALTALKLLQSLNLVGTKTTAQSILQLKELKQLQFIYLYNSKIGQKDWVTLWKSFPHARLDSGGYHVPLYVTDTSLVKPPKTQ